ncbi:uncharacterized protein BDR25DRAFT_319536 [Lindgomyces ingoldianus]|uniref:Uncharacterized protein n=1 Tax=Lindgomyces ingoldianus TaxID=673940 RepID=A0ACB6QCA5_9PLEO|nr:uncharacterized protein BDR25DRAFT_319536 [Lindgomyces ingoldianus]KAF2464007.1 hypothetical protein BDR25DRAFT_319536 [Lindgomyces ingoldianus]
MRFLCLHGLGTNNILHANCIPQYPITTKTYNYFDVNDARSMLQALVQLDTFISLEGPFDGVIAYSHGAGFIATYIVEKAVLNAQPPFKCAIFFSAARPVNPESLRNGELRFMDGETDGVKITMPTAHIWGDNDDTHRACHPRRKGKGCSLGSWEGNKEDT